LYRVTIERKAKKELDALPQSDGNRVALAMRGLRDDPRPHVCVKIGGTHRELYRLRVGRYRVVYEVQDAILLVLVVRVAKRGEGTYRRL
jgi:mRNA interferase RelE/StbE